MFAEADAEVIDLCQMGGEKLKLQDALSEVADRPYGAFHTSNYQPAGLLSHQRSLRSLTHLSVPLAHTPSFLEITAKPVINRQQLRKSVHSFVFLLSRKGEKNTTNKPQIHARLTKICFFKKNDTP